MSVAAQKIAVIGAGYAGMAAAATLAAEGKIVDVFETSRTLGGRARAVPLGDETLDNGQHILVGAYTETLRLMKIVGADPTKLLKRIPLRLEFPGEFLLVAPRLPAPLHLAFALLAARGITWREKFAAVRLMQGLQRDKFRIQPDISVAQWLSDHPTAAAQGIRKAPLCAGIEGRLCKADTAHNDKLRKVMWEPLCIAALNTPVADASAQVLANVLRDSLASSRAASDFLLPQVDLSNLFPEPAAAFVEAHGGKIHRQHRVTNLRSVGNHWQIDDDQIYDQVILAVAPYHLAALVPELARSVEHFAWEPIVTTYLSYPGHVRLPQAMLGISDGYAQWLFDRGTLCGQHGMIAAVISARGRHLDIPMSELERHIHAEIGRLIPDLPEPIKVQTITEKRATFSCVPNLQRPMLHTHLPGLFLAGDYVAGDYPATIEGAVRAGVAAALVVLAPDKIST
ncbi:MAG: FAD-dependent oxidoreductase [Rhodocyclaceae bacterium]|nr:FAD-dependent oxidoreductase [Rhodocyclaceae bacterium]